MADETEPHYLGHRQRLRDRFLRSGLESFADYETVELLLTLAVPRSDVKQPAKALIERFGNLRGILDAPLDELRAVDRIGSVTPVALRIIKAAATSHLQTAKRREGFARGSNTSRRLLAHANWSAPERGIPGCPSRFQLSPSEGRR